jgi:hypothetical protein
MLIISDFCGFLSSLYNNEAANNKLGHGISRLRPPARKG